MGDITPPYALRAAHDVSAFDCGKDALTDWIRHRAKKSEARGARTFVVCETANRVVGYYALAAGAVERARSPSSLSRNMPDPIPVIVLARLAVDQAWSGKGIGGGLLKDALKRALAVSQNVGARAMLVHAIDDDAVAFYQQYGFRPFPSETRTLFLPLEHVAAVI
ncbi:MAG TPA: GNAT family N-acetyltransferase [Rhizomicrobium sp.]